MAKTMSLWVIAILHNYRCACSSNVPFQWAAYAPEPAKLALLSTNGRTFGRRLSRDLYVTTDCTSPAHQTQEYDIDSRLKLLCWEISIQITQGWIMERSQFRVTNTCTCWASHPLSIEVNWVSTETPSTLHHEPCTLYGQPTQGQASGNYWTLLLKLS